MKILVISLPVWINENNSGNTLSNVFAGFDAEFANIYCSGGFPNNSICKKYFQVTDFMVINKLLKNKTIGKSFVLEEIKNDTNSDLSFENSAKKYKGILATILREIAWKMVKIDNDEMYRFIEGFKPDVIYAPCYGNFRMLRLVRNIKKRTNLPLISFISDDLYNYKKDANILENIYQYFLRKSLKKTFKIYNKVYTMTDEQSEEYGKIFDKNIGILRKSVVVPYEKHIKNKQMNIIYAGGTYEGREDTLVSIVEEIKKNNLNVKLDIYTNSTVNNKTILDDGVYANVYKALTYKELLEKYHSYDIALHAESFEPMYASKVRLSFSTKIIDCLQSGAVMLAVGPKGNAGFNFLEKENAAYVVTDIADIKKAINDIDGNYEIWQDNAYKCINKCLNKNINTKNLYDDFEKVIKPALR